MSCPGATWFAATVNSLFAEQYALSQRVLLGSTRYTSIAGEQ